MKEADIRPQDTFEEFLRLAREDVRTFFGAAPLEHTPCPACGGAGEFAFRKELFDYELCPGCLTLYVSPRPVKAAFEAYYRDSPSTKFWAETFYTVTREARREKIWRPKAALVAGVVAARIGPKCTLVDIGGGYGIFAEEMEAASGLPVTIIEPSLHLAQACRDKGLTVVEKFLEEVRPGDLPGGPKCFASFELFEHLHSPRAFLAVLRELMGPGDLFVFTTLNGTGADILALWGDSKSVSPPHHLNFLNPESASRLLCDEGFEVVDISTPGALDVDIMANNRDRLKDRFWSAFLSRADDRAKSEMQEFLAANRLSSHMMVTARKV